ncbi:glucose-6-phosphate isomerase family protein [Methanolapillus ohkumae]|uniref:glucose-6-phosphate isomerase n=1 Tax=Methanolapillus ohkumae TaxID=3028298 RepID=A0AA96ZX08_9EURY|nr:Glucose-6-phosphate isomerase [Methanosarcinaceae archaeon Am2]
MNSQMDFSKVCTAFKTRRLYDMSDVLMDQIWLKSQPDRVLYDMYREVHLSGKDLTQMKTHVLRYDITVIPPGMLGPEYIKTAGHYHPPVSHLSCADAPSYPEVYQVIHGTATYLLQKRDLSEFIVIEAKEGDVVLIPPDFGHVTVNTSLEKLTMANWVSDAFESEYEPIREKAGLLYYLTEDGFCKNKNYEQFPEIAVKKPKSYPEFELFSGVDMYGLACDLDKLEFLRHPEKFMDAFRRPFYESAV